MSFGVTLDPINEVKDYTPTIVYLGLYPDDSWCCQLVFVQRNRQDIYVKQLKEAFLRFANIFHMNLLISILRYDCPSILCITQSD